MVSEPEARSGLPRAPETNEPAEPEITESNGLHHSSGLVPGAGLQDIRLPIYGQGIVVSLVVAGLVLILAIIAAGKPTAQRLPIAQTTTVLFWILAVVTMFVAGAGAQFAERTAEHAAAALGHTEPRRTLPTAWAVPVVAAFAAIFLVATYHSGRMLIIGPVIAFLGVAGSQLARDLLDDDEDTTKRTATIIHATVIHIIAFLALSAVYLNKMTSWISAPLAFAIGALLVLEVLQRGEATTARRIGYALLGGVALFEAMIALNWWPTHGWIGGALLLVCFYVAAGVLLARTQRAVLRSRDLIDFGIVGLVAFIILAAIA